MVEKFPKCVFPYIEKLPENRNDKSILANIKKFGDMYGEKYVESIVWSQEDAKNILSRMGVKESELFFQFYLNSFELPKIDKPDDLYGLSEIYADFLNSYWSNRYPGIEKKFLQLSSIEGEFSYFYNKETGEVFGVEFDQMDLLWSGELKPLFSSFYEFLDWYFSDSD